jgi:hypothetical protein
MHIVGIGHKRVFLLFEAQIRSCAADIAGQRVEIPQLHPLSEGNSARTRTFAKTDGHSTSNPKGTRAFHGLVDCPVTVNRARIGKLLEFCNAYDALDRPLRDRS